MNFDEMTYADTTNDPQARGLLRQFLENNTGASHLGVGAACLIALLGG